MIRFFLTAALALLAMPQARAADPQTAIALRVIDTYVVPHYRTLEQAALAQHQAWSAYCKDPGHGDKGALTAAFHRAQDEWEAIEHVRTGPVSLFLRAERIDYWPEARNATAKGLASLLAGSDPHELEPESFAGGSVAAQGFPALERLLFGGVDLSTPRACAIGQAIALNLSSISNEIVSDWMAADGPRAGLVKGIETAGGFADGAEAARGLLTDLMTSFQRMLDLKLLAIMGESAEAAKPKAAEEWRSARSTRNLKINLDSTNEMIAIFAQGLDPAALAPLTQAMGNAQTALAALPDDLGAAAGDASQRAKLDAAVAALKAARDQARAILPALLNITLGFNALDGD